VALLPTPGLDAVKVLDFGLAKQSRDREGADPDNSPTLTMGATQAGMISGTAKGKNVDKRADTWAFGVVLYELLAGRVKDEPDRRRRTRPPRRRANPGLARLSYLIGLSSTRYAT
jgi:serine/threonine protein kinase